MLLVGGYISALPAECVLFGAVVAWWWVIGADNASDALVSLLLASALCPLSLLLRMLDLLQQANSGCKRALLTAAVACPCCVQGAY